MSVSLTVVEQGYLEPHGRDSLDWQGNAACAGTDTEKFFADGRTSPQAVAACAACPVAEACREYAIGRDWIYGIWGGTTKAERDRIRRDRGVVRVPEVCARGHEMTGENTYLPPSGGWYCRTCARDNKRRRKAA